MQEEDVILPDASAPQVPAGGQGRDETVTLTKAQHEGLLRERDEARESERYWSGLARNGGRGPQPVADPVEDEPIDTSFLEDVDEPNLEGDTPEKLVDEFAAQGVGALKKRGFITAADAHKLAVDVASRVTRELIGQERQKMTTDAQIMADFPELKDPNSELFQETAKHYQRAVAMDPAAKKTPAALYLAAQAAKASLKGRAPAPRQDDGFEPEHDRRQRAASQDARPRARGPVEEPDDMLGDEARQVIRQMGISEDEYKASRKAMGNTGQRGRRAA